ncbi:MAG TPA: fused MFS/spermidine synthase [Candidatus Krumholzibacteria bacterium]|nr:fused MFS/spermidine synthase [Candidatus Krumholzibacteria bacterium]
MAHFALYTVVSISGASVLAIEILGTRVLGPFYGVSLFLWSALITVTLAALAAGYALGGRWADRGPRLSRLGVLLAAAGVWILVVPWMREPLLAAVEPLGLRAAVLAGSMLLFAPPLLLLGMVSPYAVRLAAKRLDDVGRTAGNLFAVSTLASVVSALLTGFFLIPSLGVTRLLLLIGCALLGGAALAWFTDRRALRGGAVGLVAAIAGVAAWDGSATRIGAGVLAHIDSPYAEIRVLESNDIRYLMLDGGIHTSVQPHTWISSHRYVAAVSVAKFFFDRPGDLLLVGLGGGAVVKDFAADGWKIDAVEIDAVVARVAETHFGLRPEECRIFCMDGRRFLRDHDTVYDVVVLDAFGSSSIPFHLVTREMFALVAEHLAPRGIVAINVETRGWDDPLLASIAATLATSFTEVVALPTSEPPNTLGNIVLFGARRSLELADDAIPHPQGFLANPAMHEVIVQKNHAWDNRYRPEMRGAIILTDDRNPVDLWSESVNRIARRSLHEFFASQGRHW